MGWFHGFIVQDKQIYPLNVLLAFKLRPDHALGIVFPPKTEENTIAGQPIA